MEITGAMQSIIPSEFELIHNESKITESSLVLYRASVDVINDQLSCFICINIYTTLITY